MAMPTVSEDIEEDDYVAFVRPQRRSRLIRRTLTSTSTATTSEYDELSVTLTLTTISSEENGFATSLTTALPAAVQRSLETPLTERSSHEVDAIFNFARHLQPLTNYTDEVKRAICAKCFLAKVPEAGTVLYSIGSRMDSWGIVLRGEVELMNAQGEQSLISKGESFGVWPNSCEQMSTSTVRTLTSDCQFLLISQTDFVDSVKGPKTRICYDQSTGAEVCEFHALTTGGRVITKATMEKLVEWLVEGYWMEADERFVEDFFLTYRAVTTPTALFHQLLALFDEKPSPVAGIILQWINLHFEDFDGTVLNTFQRLLESAKMDTELLLLDMAVSGHSKSRSIILKRSEASDPLGFEYLADGWYVTKSDLPGFERGDQIITANGYRLQQMTTTAGERILRGNCVLDLEVKRNPLGFKEALRRVPKSTNLVRKFVRKCSMRNKRSNRWTLPRSKPDTSTSSSESSNPAHISIKERTTQAEESVIKVYRSDQTFRFLVIYSNTPAQAVVQLALKEFDMTEESSTEWTLAEVTVTTEGVIKQHRIPDHACAVADRIRSNNRFYLKSIRNSDLRLSDEVIEEIAANSEISFLQCDASAIASALMERNQELFSKISQVEFIKHLFKNGCAKEWSNLSAFEVRFNWEVSWVVTAVCSEKSLNQRVRTIKKLIKVAIHCRNLKNLNSMFAIVSGLENRSVARLALTWEKIPQKYLNLLNELKQLCDPTKNMLEYRRHLAVASQSPPVIPILPFLCKDLYFANSGNPTWSSEKMVNFSKLRMIAKIIRDALEMARIPTEAQVPLKDWRKSYESMERTLRINEYLDRFNVIDSELLQEQMSQECEQRRKPVRTPSTMSSRSSQSMSSAAKTPLSSPWTSRRRVNTISADPPPPPGLNERLI